MRTAPCFILLSICATMGVLLTSALSDQEMEALRAPLRQRGDLADYVLFAELVFGTEAQATQMKDSLSAGRITLIQAMQRQRQGDGKSSGNSRNSGGSTVSIVKRKRPVKAAEDGGARPAGQRDKRPDLSEMMANRGDLSGGMNQDDGGDNLQSLETLHPAVAEYALSVSYPPADDSGPNPIGPIRLDDNTYVVLIVFFRYRRSFFGEEWHRLEQFCNDNFIDFGQTVRDMAMQKELLKTMIYQLFQGESTYLRLVRLETLNRDLKRVGAEKDPSTLLPKPGKKMDKLALEELIERRRAFNDALPQWVKDQHPEAMMMDEDDVIANGWTLPTPPVVAVAMDGDTVGEAAWRDAAETEEKRSVSDEQGGSNDEL